MQAVDVALVMKALEPVWQKKPETASRVRQRVESVLDWARARKFGQGENPARWRGHPKNLLPAPRKIRRVEHHAALPYGEVSAFVQELRAQPGAAARAPELVDIDRDHPGLDDSASLCGLITSVCRPSLHLAPGFMLVAAQLSGSGSGKGLLTRAICLTAFGRQPAAFTSGKSDELEKRLAAHFTEGGPVLFLDNVNNAVLSSPTWEHAMTDRPFKVRLFGMLKNALLDAAPFVVVTGNGLTPSPDLVRRFAMFARLDARMEIPSQRRFKLADHDYLLDIERRRAELLSAVQTIWRFGRQNEGRQSDGLPIGSYSAWARADRMSWWKGHQNLPDATRKGLRSRRNRPSPARRHP